MDESFYEKIFLFIINESFERIFEFMYPREIIFSNNRDCHFDGDYE